MFYTIYKVTNLLSNKYYVGKHMTKDLDDGYMGSGKLIRRAIKKHGRENFKKEILYIFDNEEAMNAKEAELVIVSEETYNLCDGGHGGFGYINQNPDLFLTEKRLSALNKYRDKAYAISKSAIRKKMQTDLDFKNKWIQKSKKAQTILHEKYPNGTFYGKHHTQETKNRMSVSAIGKHIGDKNSQYGTMWITNGVVNKKILKTESIPDGFYKGRKILDR